MNAVQRMVQPDAAGRVRQRHIGPRKAGITHALAESLPVWTRLVPATLGALSAPSGRASLAATGQLSCHHRGAPGTLGTNPQTAGQLPWSMLLLGLKHAASWHGLFFLSTGVYSRRSPH